MTKIVGVGPHYHSLLREKNEEVKRPLYLFIKPFTSIISDEQNIQIPHYAEKVLAEVEIAIQIKRTISNEIIEREQLMEVINGFAVANDITAFGENIFGSGKLYDTFTPISEFTPFFDGIIQIESYLNGNLMQSSSSEDMSLGFADIITYCSSILTLEQGDIILTGTPSGPFEIKPEDSVRIMSPQLGSVTNTVVDGRKRRSSYE